MRQPFSIGSPASVLKEIDGTHKLIEIGEQRRLRSAGSDG
jgi:hypothetical protein